MDVHRRITILDQDQEDRKLAVDCEGVSQAVISQEAAECDTEEEMGRTGAVEEEVIIRYQLQFILPIQKLLILALNAIVGG